MNKQFVFSTLSFLGVPVSVLAANGEVVVSIFRYALAAHVILGVIGVMLLYMVWMGLLKRAPRIKFLVWSSFAALVSILASWGSALAYYVHFYGENVKPVIKAGEYSWAHSLVTETKEHVFLVLPFLAFILFITLFLRGDKLETEEGLKKGLVYVAGLAAIIGILITLAGVVISGAAR